MDVADPTPGRGKVWHDPATLNLTDWLLSAICPHGHHMVAAGFTWQASVRMATDWARGIGCEEAGD